MRAPKEPKQGHQPETAGEMYVANPVRHYAAVSSDSARWVARVQSAGIKRVPTHAGGWHHERRAYVRARLSLPLRMQRVAGQPDSQSHPLHTLDISSSGVFFYYPQRIDPGTPIELEVLLVDRPVSRGSVRMRSVARVVRAENIDQRGWHGVAATFDDISFLRDE